MKSSLELNLDLTPVRDILKNFDQRISLLEERLQSTSQEETIRFSSTLIENDQPPMIQSLYNDLVGDHDGDDFYNLGLDSLLDDSFDTSMSFFPIDPALTVPLLAGTLQVPVAEKPNPRKVYSREELMHIKQHVMLAKGKEKIPPLYSEIKFVPIPTGQISVREQSSRVSDHFPQRSPPSSQKSPRQKKSRLANESKPNSASTNKKSPKSVWDQPLDTVKSELRFGLLVEYPDSDNDS